MINKHKHLDYIQSTITRMSNNSFYLKGWNITIISAIIALSTKNIDDKIYVCAFVLNVIFWFLDAYYLHQEKLFRKLYDDVSKINKDEDINFSMNASKFKTEIPSIMKIMFWNVSITLLYGFIALILLFVIFFNINLEFVVCLRIIDLLDLAIIKY